MGSYDEDLARIEKDLREAESERDRLSARIEGLKAERDALKKLAEAREGPAQEIAGLTKAEAIVKILKASDQSMTLGDMAEAMTAAGKLTNPNGASVYIDGLLKAGRVVRVKRGHYRAA
jgi:chromosome segregation ATPase